jgi:YegS/Rv2252/BmrU family lipid kinase
MIGIFVNPRAGKGKALQIKAVVENALQKKNIQFITYTDIWPEHINSLTETWVIGGDGTLNYFINTYRNINIPIVIFKGGTGNDFAWKLYGNRTSEEQISLVLSAQTQPVDAAICNGKLFVNSVGIGFDGEVLRSMGAIRKLGGHIGYLWVVIKKIFSFREFSFTISTLSQNSKEKYLLVNIANAPRTGGGFLISPNAEINDGRLNMILCKPLSLLQRLRFLPVIEKGKHLNLPFIHHQSIEHTTVSCTHIIHAQLDGELISDQHFEISILPGHLLFKV